MSQAMVNFRLNKEVKKEMELACKDMGMSLTTAFTIFATKVSKERRIPFEITAHPTYDAFYNSSTSIIAREETEQLAKDPTAKAFKTMEALIADLESDEDA